MRKAPKEEETDGDSNGQGIDLKKGNELFFLKQMKKKNKLFFLKQREYIF